MVTLWLWIKFDNVIGTMTWPMLKVRRSHCITGNSEKLCKQKRDRINHKVPQTGMGYKSFACPIMSCWFHIISYVFTCYHIPLWNLLGFAMFLQALRSPWLAGDLWSTQRGTARAVCAPEGDVVTGGYFEVPCWSQFVFQKTMKNLSFGLEPAIVLKAKSAKQSIF